MTPTPADYAALFAKLEGPRDCAWPLIMRDSLAVEDALVDDDSDAAIAARAAWWTALVAPRREAAVDPESDKRLEYLDEVAGWQFGGPENMSRWLPVSRLFGRNAASYSAGITTRELRGLLTFFLCETIYSHNPQAWCEENDRVVFSSRRAPDPDELGKTCWESLVYERRSVEPVPQRDASHGARCGCWPTKAGCKFCNGASTVRDGRRDGQHDYDACLTMEGRSIAGFYAANDAVRQSAIANELAHRRAQPDACGHPDELVVGEDWLWLVNKLMHRQRRAPDREWLLLCALQDRATIGLARAPLAETLHAERDAYDSEATTYGYRQTYGVGDPHYGPR